MAEAARNKFERIRRLVVRDVNRMTTEYNNIARQALNAEQSNRLELYRTDLSECKVRYDESFNEYASTLGNSEADLATEEAAAQERDSFLTAVSKLIAKITTKCTDFKGAMRRESIVNASVSETGGGHVSSIAKMPKIPLPKFEGDLRFFYDFKAMFENLVHNEETIPRVQKMHYLRESLVGEASTILRNIPLSDAGYQEAWGRVLSKYDNKRTIIHMHLSDLFSLGNAKIDSELQNLLDQFDSSLRGLRACGESTDNWATLLSYWLYTKIDPRTRTDYDNTNDETSRYYVFKSLWKFCESRALAIEARKVNTNSSTTNKQGCKPASLNPSKKILIASTSANTRKCQCCKREFHRLVECKTFRDKTPQERFEVIKNSHLCRNCFSSFHNTRECEKPPCKFCKNKHNTFLHFESKSSSASANYDNRQPVNSTSKVPLAVIPSTTITPSVHVNNGAPSLSTAFLSSFQPTIVLPSALVQFQCNIVSGNIRTLLDSCAQSSLITESFVKRYRLKVYELDYSHSISGIGNSHVNCNRYVKLKLLSRVENFSIEVNATVISTPISYALRDLSMSKYSEKLRDFVLADPEFYKPVVSIPEIDMLLSVDVVERVSKEERAWIDSVCLKNTHFGWTISSEVYSECLLTSLPSVEKSLYCALSIDKLDERLKNFFHTEDYPNENTLSKQTKSTEADSCVQHFLKTTTRHDDGKFVTRLPFKEDPLKICNNRNRAFAYLKHIEKKLDAATRTAYVAFMQEYCNLNHMSLVLDNDTQPRYFIPHHAIFRPSSTTTKLRVVFNASSKSACGLSLNDLLLIGPSIQPELFDILIKFRTYLIAFVADVAMMYRCILMHHSDRKYQSILWRESPNDPVKVYELNTVTYGTAPASFLATKCLEFLANEHSESNPAAAAAIKNNFYMDDLLCGAPDVESAIELRQAVHGILSSAGLELRKYQSNSASFLDTIDPKLIESNLTVNIGGQESLSLLGLTWSPASDSFSIKCQLSKELESEKITKRVVLSEISKIFDPLGLISPVSIRGKLLMQRLWKLKLDWDIPVPDQIFKDFKDYVTDLSKITSLQINRFYGPGQLLNLIGFSDASEAAMCAAVYVRTLNNGVISNALVCSKTRVAPIKSRSIPELELQAAVLLSELTERVRCILSLNRQIIRLYTDSQVVLSWLTRPTKPWKPFVKNRVSKIIEFFPIGYWNYVNTADNPADLSTRGITACKFLRTSMWFEGPRILAEDISLLREEIPYDSIAESYSSKSKPVHNLALPVENNLKHIESISVYQRLRRIYSSVAKMFQHWKNKVKGQAVDYDSSLSSTDLSRGEFFLIRIVQQSYFFVDFQRLSNKRNLSKRSVLHYHCPFIDSEGIIRSKTRLQNAPVPFNQKLPFLLPAKCHLTVILVRYLHVKFFHANHQVIITHLSSNYQFVGGISRVAKKIIKGCLTCIRYRGKITNQLMADLPQDRVTAVEPFKVSGVDFTGAFTVKCNNHRSLKYIKVYACIFVCFVTRAVHIETVSSLTTEAFLNALHRFVGRRGLPAVIYSDNGTNFVGANNYLNFEDSKFQSKISDLKIQWKFNLPGTPHRGGLWEAAVKSAKSLLVKVTNDQVLTMEELETYLVRIEMILNSRPISYRSTNEPEFEIISPGHFLIGRNLTLIPEPEIPSKVRLSDRYPANQRRIEFFWRLWYADYLNSIKKRTKWSNVNPNVSVGQVVIIKDKLSPPNHWRLGRVVQVLPDLNGIVRTAEVLTNGESKLFAINHLILLDDVSTTSDF